MHYIICARHLRFPLRYRNLVVLTKFLMNLRSKSKAVLMRCVHCYQWPTELLEMCLSSSKKMHQRIAIITHSSFCATRHSFINPDMWPDNSGDWSLLDYHTVSCCLLKFKLLYNITTGCFQSHSLLRGNNTTSIRWMSSAFHKVMHWHFTCVVDKFFLKNVTFLQNSVY